MAGDDTSPRAADGALARWWRHLGPEAARLRRTFDAAAFDRIERAIEASERAHRAELRFAIEPALSPAALWRGASARERAVDVFSDFRIWDTEEDNGVLIYVLWAEHAVEILADRGAARSVDPAVWQAACATIRDAFRGGRAVDGVVAAIESCGAALARVYPAGDRNPDELSNRPIIV